MLHIQKTAEQELSTRNTDWYRVGSEMIKLVNDWSNRSDLMVYAGPRKLPAAGLFQPSKGLIEIDTEQCFPFKAEKDVHLDTRIGMYHHPVGVGVAIHEAMHARFTSWDMPKAMKALSKAEMSWMELLEETRIETLGARILYNDRQFLRANALNLTEEACSKETLEKISSGTRQVGHAAILSWGRVDGLVLNIDDITELHQVIVDHFSEEAVTSMRNIWREFQTTQFVSEEETSPRLYQLAREFEALMKEEAEKNGEVEDAGTGDMMQAIMDALGSDAQDLNIQVDAEMQTEIHKENSEALRKKKQMVSREIAESEAAAKQVFKDRNHYSSAARDQQSELTHSMRLPTPEEKSAVVTLSRELNRAKYRDKLKTTHASVIPPGRLRTRSLVLGAALKEQGIYTPVPAFNATKRKVIEDPDIRVGMMVDFSGSMGGAMGPMGSAAYIIGEAVRRNRGQAAQVYFGRTVFATLEPNDPQTTVRTQSARDAYEDMDIGFKALNGKLNLLNGHGARLLVIASDGEFKGDQIAPTHKWLKRCREAGVAVLWLAYGSGGGIKQFTDVPELRGHVQVVVPDGTVQVDVMKIGSAAVKALARASAR